MLLYNQSRVFSHILGRVFADVGSFLRDPIIPAFRQKPVSKLQTASAASPDNGKDGDGTAESKDSAEESPKKGEAFRQVVAWFLTPKYLLFLLTAFLGIATGWSQLELQHLRNAADSFEKSVQLNAELERKMEQTVLASKTQAEKLEAEKELALQDAARIQSELNQASSDLEVSVAEVRRLTDQVNKLQTDAQLDENSKDAQIASLNKEIKSYVEKLAQAKASLRIAESQASRLGDVEGEKRSVQAALDNERRDLTGRISELQKRVNQLVGKEYLLIDALECIKTLEREVGRSRFRKHRAEKALETFRLQEETRSKSLNLEG